MDIHKWLQVTALLSGILGWFILFANIEANKKWLGYIAILCFISSIVLILTNFIMIINKLS